MRKINTPIAFLKMQSLGNDFVILRNGEDLSQSQIVKICNRRIGIGCDQLIIIEKYVLDSRSMQIRFYNQDGLSASFCGNGLRCLGGLFFSENPDLEECYFNIIDHNKQVSQVKCNKKSGDLIAIEIYNPGVINKDNFDLIDVGNLHKVIFVDENDPTPPIPYHSTPHLEYNINYVKIINQNSLAISTVERGSGPTPACGSGSCASVFYAVTKNILPYDTYIKVINQGIFDSKGESLEIIVDKKTNIITMKGTYRNVGSGNLSNTFFQ